MKNLSFIILALSFWISTTAQVTSNCQNVTVFLNSSGTISVNPSQIDAGSTGNGPLTYLINNNSTTNYNCANIGANTATLTVTDSTGASASCNATVTVIDSTPPTAVCASSINLYLDSTGTATAYPYHLNNGSTDGCGISSILINNSNSITYTAANIGNNPVTLTVTDLAGNSSTCNSMIVVARPTSVPKLPEVSTFNIFPNPAKDKVTIKSERESIKTIHIYNSIGQLVYNLVEINQNQLELDLQHLTAPNLYYIAIETNNGSISQKLLLR